MENYFSGSLTAKGEHVAWSWPMGCKQSLLTFSFLLLSSILECGLDVWSCKSHLVTGGKGQEIFTETLALKLLRIWHSFICSRKQC